jgi:hypothetical protein
MATNWCGVTNLTTTGKPDKTKWTYNYGFIANQEKQYYTDST